MIVKNRLIAEIKGDTDTLRVGEFIWIGGSQAANEFDEFGQVIIATSTRSSRSPVSPYSITIMKLIEVKDGEYRLFKYGTDILTLRMSSDG